MQRIIRYLNGLVEASNPYIKVLDVHKEEFKVSCPYITYRRKLEVEHVNSVKYFTKMYQKMLKLLLLVHFVLMRRYLNMILYLKLIYLGTYEQINR